MYSRSSSVAQRINQVFGAIAASYRPLARLVSQRRATLPP
ncbi:MAG: hypothetical protein RJA36_1617 [Pseudomonadota bacterium]|jgi:hypothetical protein